MSAYLLDSIRERRVYPPPGVGALGVIGVDSAVIPVRAGIQNARGLSFPLVVCRIPAYAGLTLSSLTLPH
ncbi:hypothetical protein [Nocardia sp. NPDC057440]|uniref:hypothetical protein n=1 Tax=Nocardia sp. NPDC057440 TaxID=3346134 RepID=UPI00366A79DB